MKTPQQIIDIFHSVEDIRLNENNALEVRFKDSSPGEWDEIVEFNRNTFSRKLLELVEDELQGNLD